MQHHFAFEVKKSNAYFSALKYVKKLCFLVAKISNFLLWDVIWLHAAINFWFWLCMKIPCRINFVAFIF